MAFQSTVFLSQLLIAASLLAASFHPAAAQDLRAELAEAYQNAAKHYHAGRVHEALPFVERALPLAEQIYGKEHGETAKYINMVGEVYRALGRNAEAEPLLVRALSMAETFLGPNHVEAGTILGNLGRLRGAVGRHAEALPLFDRALTIFAQKLGPERVDTAVLASDYADACNNTNNFDVAEVLSLRALPLLERQLPPLHPSLMLGLVRLAVAQQGLGKFEQSLVPLLRAATLSEQAHGRDSVDLSNILAWVTPAHIAMRRFDKAEETATRRIDILQAAVGADHGATAQAVHQLATIYSIGARFVEAEPLFKRAVQVFERVHGGQHPELGKAIAGLASTIDALGRTEEAEGLFRRALAIAEANNDKLEAATALGQLAILQTRRKQYTEAEATYLRAIRLTEEVVGPNHPEVAFPVHNLASVYSAQKRMTEAETLLKRAIALREKEPGAAVGTENLASSLNNLALTYLQLGRYAESESLYERTLKIVETIYGPNGRTVSTALFGLGHLHYTQGQWDRAVYYWQRSVDVIVQRVARNSDAQRTSRGGRIETEAAQEAYRFRDLLVAQWVLAEAQPARRQELARSAFKAAQWAIGSQAAASLAQMAARVAATEPGVGQLMREREELIAAWQEKDRTLIAARAQTPEKRDAKTEAGLGDAIARLDDRLNAIEKRLASSFAGYNVLARPDVLTVEDVQALLGPDEALLLLFEQGPSKRSTPGGEELEVLAEWTGVWAVTKTGFRWVRSQAGLPMLKREVAALRCGLDLAAWQDDGKQKCSDLLGTKTENATNDASQLPFPVGRAHVLYKALFGELQDMLRGKHLLVVPSGALTQLPFHALVTKEPGGEGYKSAAWLARQHAITVLPGVSSLKSLRRVAKPSSANKPMLGIGNPLLDGDPASRPWEADWAKLARQKQACPQTPWQRVAGIFRVPRSVLNIAKRGGRADLDQLRSQTPLHDTADELCAVASALRLAPDDIMLGAAATETNIKKLSAEGKLAGYRVLHFATHGTMSGEIEGVNEPGLILTPPKDQSDEDDGFLTASEVAALKLDADWVILSACNTAAGGSEKAEALSGLARAFFYAGARALLVSHWGVDSAATVKLITQAVKATASDKKLGRADALRRSMLAMIDKGEPREAHPALWAPFVVVGEGAVAK